MQQKGYAFDYISDRQIEKLSVDKGKIATGGVSYQTIVIPGIKFMLAATLQKLVRLAENGAIVIFYNGLPMDVPGYAELDQHRKLFHDLINKMHFNKNKNGVEMAETGRGKIYLSADLMQILQLAGIRRETMVDSGLEYARRQNEDGSEFYFLANRSDKFFEGWVNAQTKANGAALYHPMSGDSGVARFKKSANGCLSVFLQLEPGESIIVQTSKNAIKGTTYPYLEKTGKPLHLNGKWTVTFLSGGPVLPEKLQLDHLQPWTDFKDTSYQVFSGTASYVTHFKMPESKTAHFLLNLGEVNESAEVYLNSKKVATVIGAVFSCKLNREDLKEDNVLEIRIANSMANRIIDLDKNHVYWKKFNNINFAAKLPQDRGKDGLFNAAKWEPVKSGLTGPVTITPIK
jgi:hypothetical protein